MSRLYLNAKEKVEDCLALHVSPLNKSKIFKTSNSGTLSWVDSDDKLNYVIGFDDFTPTISISYSVTYSSGQQQSINQTFYLSKTFCNFEGSRYWFICSCGKRVGILYKPSFSDTFACRHCYNLTYQSRNRSGFEKQMGKAPSIPELDALRESVKRTSYKGKPTKRFIKYKQKLNQFEAYYVAWRGDFNKIFLKKEISCSIRSNTQPLWESE